MRDVAAVIRLELLSLFGINRARHTKDPQEQRRYVLLAVAFLMLGAMAVFYTGALAVGLCSLGLGAIVPTYLAALTALLLLAFGLFRAGGAVFSPRGYDILCALPLRRGAIATARLVALYVADLALSALLFLPGMIAYALMTAPSIGFYLSLIPCLLALPVIPLVISLLFGTALTALIARSRHKSLLGSLISVVFVLATLLLSTGAGNAVENLSPEQLTDLANTVGATVAAVYPPAAWVGAAITQNSLLSLLLFVGVSAVSAVLSLYLVSLCFERIVRAMSVSRGGGRYRAHAVRARAPIFALVHREAKRYFASVPYVVNTILGPILSLVMAGALLVSGQESVIDAFPFDITPVIPFVVTATAVMMPTASVSLSMEGRQIWIAKSLPLPMRALCAGKILFNLILLAPSWLLSQLLLLFALRPAIPDAVGQVLLTGALTLFAAVFALWVNVKIHRFDWVNETTVIKQSAPALLGGFAGPLTCFACGALVLLLPAALRIWTELGLAALLLLLAALLVRAMSRTETASL